MAESGNEGGGPVVICHPERGVFVGEFLGMAFWSNWEAGGQEAACAFADETNAREFVANWEGDDSDPDAFEYKRVEPDRKSGETLYCSADALRDAGLDDYLGELARPEWRSAPGHA